MAMTLQAGPWAVEATASTAEFSVRNMGFNTVRGSFPISSATVTVGPDGKPAGLYATLEAGGFTTGNLKRDTHIKSPQFLDAVAYPVLSFTSKSITEVGPREWRISGDLTIRDQVSPLVLIARSDGALDGAEARVWATGQINRREAGVANGPTFLIGNEVSIELSVVVYPAA